MLEAAIATTLYHPNVINTYAYDIRPLRMCPVPAAGGGGGGAGGSGGHSDSEGGGVMDWKLYIIQVGLYRPRGRAVHGGLGGSLVGMSQA